MQEVSLLGTSIAFIGASLAVACGCLGSAKGVGYVGEAGAGVLTENPEMFSSVLVMQILPGTQGLYGIVIWFMALMKLGFFDEGLISMSIAEGFQFMAATLPIALGGLFGVYQGKLCVNGLVALVAQPKQLPKSILMAIMVEFYSILTLLATFLMLNQFK